ncbi:MAG: flagellar biosynthesis protein FlgI [Gammaproteobacteria bacterium]|nr:MAG: flagellar biosynthesis protein FlgI [Gammaproteobacteria bacterium]RLA21762.1 MAG: flagellar biosynthesis protein FlgI [Gammaproteobacteria bacterium]
MVSRKNSYRIISLVFLLIAQPAFAERVKDIASVEGVRSNMLVGFGLVVGLNKTGDKTKFSGQSLRSMLAKMGITLPPGIDPKSKNIAAVTVHAELPPFAKPGQKIDVTVSSIGDAKSLRGGSLLMTPLKAANGQVYALAQGNLIVAGLTASGADGSSITVNIPSVGRIPGGGMIEQSVNTPFGDNSTLTLNLNFPDFTNANRLAMAINEAIGPSTARPIDGASVKVNAPIDRSQRVSFVAMLENISFEPAEAPARVIINSRTGTVVINSQVRVKPAAVSHGSLTVTISEDAQVSQPGPFSRGGETVVVPKSTVEVGEDDNHMFVFNPGVSLNEIVRAVNQVGAGPSDLVAILEALKSAGALRAELIVI